MNTSKFFWLLSVNACPINNYEQVTLSQVFINFWNYKNIMHFGGFVGTILLSKKIEGSRNLTTQPRKLSSIWLHSSSYTNVHFQYFLFDLPYLYLHHALGSNKVDFNYFLCHMCITFEVRECVWVTVWVTCYPQKWDSWVGSDSCP